MRKTVIASVLLALFFSFSCDTTIAPPRPPEPGSTITLSVEDVGVTEAWLRVTVADTVADRTVVLVRDEQSIDTTFVSSADALLLDDELMPNHVYEYKAYRLRGFSVQDTSDALQVSTLDTTSHQMIWQIDTLGDGSSSILYDVAIVSDTLVYAVGEIFVRDSLGNWVNPPYNLAKWNGRDWELITLLYNYQGQDVYVQLHSVLAFDPSNVWVAGNGVLNWNGREFGEVDLPAFVWGSDLINEMWGSSSNNIYIGGDNGSIAHFADGTWRAIESGTSASVQDIWGFLSPSATVLAVPSSSEETKILSLSGETARDTLDWPTIDRLSGVWIDKGSVVYVSGAGIWRHRGSVWNQMSGLPDQVFLTSVRGTRENDIFAVAWRGIVTHFNGVSWHQYTEISEDLNFTTVAVSEDVVVAVGFTGGLFSDKAVALVGRRIP